MHSTLLWPPALKGHPPSKDRLVSYNSEVCMKMIRPWCSWVWIERLLTNILLSHPNLPGVARDALLTKRFKRRFGASIRFLLHGNFVSTYAQGYALCAHLNPYGTWMYGPETLNELASFLLLKPLHQKQYGRASVPIYVLHVCHY